MDKSTEQKVTHIVNDYENMFKEYIETIKYLNSK
jgi:hypothetical protein